MDRLIKEAKFKCLEKNTLDDIARFQSEYSNIGQGETDVMLTYMKLDNTIDKVECILDDMDARILASRLGIKHTGLLGLLRLLKIEKLLTCIQLMRFLRCLKSLTLEFLKTLAIAHFEPLSMYCTNKSNRSHSRLLYRHSISLRYSKNFFELTPRYFAKFNLAKPQNPSIPLM